MARRSSSTLGDLLLALLGLLGIGAGVVYVARKEGVKLPELPEFPKWKPRLPTKEELYKYAPFAPLVPLAPFVAPLVPAMAAPFAVAAYLSGKDFVSRMQSALTRAGFSTQGVDGVWGPKTTVAAQGFQTSKGMPPTGLPEPPLAAALNVPLPMVPSSLGSNFVQTLLSGVQGLVQNPVDAVKLMLNESGLRSQTPGPATGIFQLLKDYVPGFTGMSVAAFEALSAAQQLPFAIKWWQQHAPASARPVSGRDLYWINFLPATYVPGALDSRVLVKNNNTYQMPDGTWLTPKKGNYYTSNQSLDHGNKGYITVGDMALALNTGARANPLLYAALANALQGAVA
jgi:hypothetical protein